MLHSGRLLVLVAAMALLAQPAGAGYRLEAVKKFFGTYEGTTISDTSDGLSTRDLNISIKPYKDKGFIVSWTTVLTKADGENKTKSYKISFIDGGRGALYRSAMRRNVFGHAVPLDPIKGEPYVWCSVVGESLIINSLHIDEKGGYEVQVHTRTLTPGGLATRFERVRDGKILKLITGELKKVN